MPDDKLSGRGIIIFKIISVFFPFVLLVIAESLLRLGGYGDNYRLFVEYKEKTGILVMNEKASLKYLQGRGRPDRLQ